MLGGGAAGLSAAHQLTRPDADWGEDFEVTVYQCGWRLGGKGASGRGELGRIEEHGLHVWFGFYRNAFALLDSCYGELRGSERRPDFEDCSDAFVAADQLGLSSPIPDYAPGTAASGWTTSCFPLPRRDSPWRKLFPWFAVYLVEAGLRMMQGDYFDLEHDPGELPAAIDRLAQVAGRITIGSPITLESTWPPERAADELTARLDESLVEESGHLQSPDDVREEELRDLAEAFESWERALIEQEPPGPGAGTEVNAGFWSFWRRPRLPRYLAGFGKRFFEVSAAVFPEARRAIWTNGDGRRRGPFDELNDLDLREVLAGRLLRPNPPAAAVEAIERLRSLAPDRVCSQEVIDSPMIRVLYDLAFAYQGGDRGAPDVAAGVAFENVVNITLGHDGTTMWKMRAGMGDVVFSPIYLALAQRRFADGRPRVRFEFFRAVERITTAASGEIAAIDVRRQAELQTGAYDPFGGGRPVWPSEPFVEQLTDDDRAKVEALRDAPDVPHPMLALERESNPLAAPGIDSLKLHEDFDEVVLALPPAAIEALDRRADGRTDLLERSSELRSMLDRAAPVATQALQVWLDSSLDDRDDPEALGWPCRGASHRIQGGYCRRFGTDPALSPPAGTPEMFDTYCEMDHLLAEEAWPDPPRHLAYFCRVAPPLGDAPAANPEQETHVEADRRAQREALAFLREHHELCGSHPPPPACDRRPYWGDDFAPSRMADPRKPPGSGWGRFEAQYARCNSAPSERYSTSHAGTPNLRLHPGDLRTARVAPVPNVVLAGDWTYTPVNAGSVEAAVQSGVEAAAALIGPRHPGPELPRWSRG